jgi:hypothetical protein
MKRFFSSLSAIILSAVIFSSCVKKDFDAPPDQRSYDPMLPVNATIKKLKTLLDPAYATTNTVPAVKIDSDWTVQGVVVADDKSGNFYKQIVIQDDSAGISILIDAYNLNNSYPVGRKVYVKLKGLYIGTYNRLPQLGYNVDEFGALTQIPGALMGNYVVGAVLDQAQVKPVSVSIAQLTSSSAAQRAEWTNRLIKIEEAEFTGSNVGVTYSVAQSSGVSRNIEDCNNNQLIVRTSGFSKFYSALTPEGKGAITAIYTVYRDDGQLVIRDTSDVDFTGNRCVGSQLPVVVGIDSIKKLPAGTITGNLKIKGVVISDRTTNNIQGQNLVIQDGNTGITLRFSSAHTFNLNDSIVVNVNGGSLSEFNGLLQVSGLANTAAVKQGTGTIVPRVATIAQINSNFEAWESTLVKVNNATVQGGGTYSGSKTLTDGTGTITMFTTFSGGGATFAADPVPTTPKSFTGILGEYNAKQLQLRNPSFDVQ